MTAIAGLVHEGKVYIGCDSLSGNATYHTKRVVTNPKVFSLKAPFGSPHPGILIGYTTSWRMGQLLQHNLSVPAALDDSEDAMDYLVRQFTEAVRSTLKSGGYSEVNNNQESGGTFLVGYAGRLFTIQGDFAVIESAEGFDACGSGGDQVLAVLHATRSSRSKPEERITTALEAAAAHNMTVQGPFSVQSI